MLATKNEGKQNKRKVTFLYLFDLFFRLFLPVLLLNGFRRLSVMKLHEKYLKNNKNKKKKKNLKADDLICVRSSIDF